MKRFHKEFTTDADDLADGFGDGLEVSFWTGPLTVEGPIHFINSRHDWNDRGEKIGKILQKAAEHCGSHRFDCHDENNGNDHGSTFTVKGATMKQAQNWVKVMSAIPQDMNPIVDETGEFAENGDTGKTHYLGGNFSGTSARAFDVDLGDTLVLPLVNVWSDQFTNSLPDLREDVVSFLETIKVTEVFLRIDIDNDGGAPEYEAVLDVSDVTYWNEETEEIEIHFPEESEDAQAAKEFFIAPEKGDRFKFRFPDDSIYADGDDEDGDGEPDGDFPAEGGKSKSYVTGYVAQIEDLPVGTHRIEFGGTIEGFGDPIVFDIEDTITVVDQDHHGSDQLIA